MILEEFLIITAIVWLAVISPGADFAIVSRNSIQYGRLAGVASSAGIASGCWVHITYAIIGLSLMTNLLPNFLVLIQYLGAIYLIYLGISTMLSPSFKDNNNEYGKQASHWKHYRTGLFTNSLNPKTSIFVMSLYSQVIGVEITLFEQLLWGAFISLSHFFWFSSITLFMSIENIRAWVLIRQRGFNLIIGLLLSLLGILLFMSDLFS